MGWGKAKEKEMVYIYKRNTPMYIGKIHIQRIYLDKIHKKKHLYSIYSKTHTGQNTKEKERFY